MKYRIEPGFQSILEVILDKGERIYAEPSSMIFHSPSVRLNTKVKGVSSAIRRMIMGKESMFLNEFYSEEGEGYIGFSPSYPGTILDIEKDESSQIKLLPGSFLAAYGEDIEITGNVGDISTYFAFDEASFLTLKGVGIFFISGLGLIKQINVSGEFIVDTGHVLAYDSHLSLSVGPEGGVKSFLFSKEGVVCKFKGEGRVWIQSINPDRFFQFLSGQIRNKKVR